MGLDNRDYLRDEERRYSGGGGGFGGFRMAQFEAPMCKKIIIVTAIVYVAQLLILRPWTPEEIGNARNVKLEILKHLAKVTGDPANEYAIQINLIESGRFRPQDVGLTNRESRIDEWLRMDVEKLKSGQVWRLVTYAFCHDRTSLFHIVMNMLLLWLIGRIVEQRIQGREFLAFYLTAAVAAGLLYLLIGFLSGNLARMVGASGAVLGILLVLTTWNPRQVIRLFGVFPVELRWVAGAVVLLDLYPALNALGGENVDGNIAHAAHLGGALFGFLYVKRSWRLTSLIADFSFQRRVQQSGFRVVRDEEDEAPATSELQSEIDVILEKISASGEGSLTRNERKKLEKASRELRNRRS